MVYLKWFLIKIFIYLLNWVKVGNEVDVCLGNAYADHGETRLSDNDLPIKFYGQVF